MERPLFGWGDWGRSRIYTSWGERGDEWAGYKDVSVSDGSWVIWLGATGLVGLAIHLALLVAPLLRFALAWPRLPARSQLLCSGLAVMVAIFCVDLLPNSGSDFLPLAYGGAVMSLAASRRTARGRARSAPGQPGIGARGAIAPEPTAGP
jgi:hypothetical protein